MQAICVSGKMYCDVINMTEERKRLRRLRGSEEIRR